VEPPGPPWRKITREYVVSEYRVFLRPTAAYQASHLDYRIGGSILNGAGRLVGFLSQMLERACIL